MTVQPKGKLPTRVNILVNFTGSKIKFKIPQKFYALICDILISMEEHTD